MVDIVSLLSTVGTLALLLVTGFVGGKLKVLDETATEKISVVVLKIVQPFLIVNSFLGCEFSPENLQTGLWILLLGLGLHGGIAVLAYLLAKPIRDLDERKISEFAMLFGNSAFIGFPILESVFGKTGLFYGAFFLASFHLVMWTWGIMILSRGRDDIKLTPRKIFINYGTIPCVIGFVLFVLGFRLPTVITSFTGYLAALGTPLSIMVAGANIARVKLKKLFANPHIYYVSAMKMIVLPLVAALIMRLMGLPEYLILFGGVMAAMPCASVVTMFGEVYKMSPGYAGGLVGTSTVLCTLTMIPVVTLVGLIAKI
jgi:predicted permease